MYRNLRRFMIAATAASTACALTACASMNVDQLHFYNGMVTVGGEGARFQEIPMTSISQKDRLYVIEHVRWEPPTAEAGDHRLEWRWYTGDKLVSQRKRETPLHMKRTPYRFFYTIPAADFDVGHYRIDVLIDDKIVDSHEIDITP